MLSFNNLELVLGGKTLFDDVSLTIHHHQKVGLVGANGTGKTSLFKIIKKEISTIINTNCLLTTRKNKIRQTNHFKS